MYQIYTATYLLNHAMTIKTWLLCKRTLNTNALDARMNEILKGKRGKKKKNKEEVEKGVRWHTVTVVFSLCSVLERFLAWFVLFCFVFLCFWLVHMYLPKGLGSDRNEQKNMSGNFLTFHALTHISHSG